MRIFLKTAAWIIGIFGGIYLAICGYLYFNQEALIFPGTKLPRNYVYNFQSPYKEYAIKTTDGDTVNACLFKATNSKGLIFYLHGNGANLQSWGAVASYYTSLGYDLFMMDYPGYGKSTGHITSLRQLFNAVNASYAFIKSNYPENHIIILGYSIGTGPAAWLASKNHPQKLILLAPYYSLGDLVQKNYSFVPAFILKYPINTYQYIQTTAAPITIFHGDADEVIYYGSSLKLKKYLKRGDTLITLHGQLHNGIDENPDYLASLKAIL
jgi:alpha-beta hydrolase superfamily lysophospholipase